MKQVLDNTVEMNVALVFYGQSDHLHIQNLKVKFTIGWLKIVDPLSILAIRQTIKAKHFYLV
jgi:hypothetical protein